MTNIKPLWKGPEKDGITFSLLSRFLSCKERFRVLTIEGIDTSPTFIPPLEYGILWHLLEDAYLSSSKPDMRPYETHLRNLLHKFPYDREEISKWSNVCRLQFPIYLEYWKKQKGLPRLKTIKPEYVFAIPYKLPSGRIVVLRGKMDCIHYLLEKKGPNKSKSGYVLQENKTKSTVDQELIQRQLTYDLQTMIYIVALDQMINTSKVMEKMPIVGVYYNVIRRPLSGGKGSIVRHKASKNKPEETWGNFYGRLKTIIEDSPQDFFFRWFLPIEPEDILRFRRECLDPILEHLCQWYDFVTTKDIWNEDSVKLGLHYRYPFGVYNSLHERGEDDLDGYLDNGSMAGLSKVESLFPELV